MKILALVALLAPLSSPASTPDADPSNLNCVQWTLATEPGRMEPRDARALAEKILQSGREFSFEFDERYPNEQGEFFFRFNHQQLGFANQETEDRYLAFVARLRKKYPAEGGKAHFGCSFAAGGLRPRISGSN